VGKREGEKKSTAKGNIGSRNREKRGCQLEAKQRRRKIASRKKNNTSGVKKKRIYWVRRIGSMSSKIRPRQLRGENLKREGAPLKSHAK